MTSGLAVPPILISLICRMQALSPTQEHPLRGRQVICLLLHPLPLKRGVQQRFQRRDALLVTLFSFLEQSQSELGELLLQGLDRDTARPHSLRSARFRIPSTEPAVQVGCNGLSTVLRLSFGLIPTVIRIQTSHSYSDLDCCHPSP